MSVIIEILYKSKTSNNNGVIGKQYTISPEQYFNFNSSNESKSFNHDTQPRYEHAIEYLSTLEPNFDKKNISETKIVIKSREGRKIKIISEKFWNEGNNCLIEHLNLYADNFSHHLIITTLIDGKYQEIVKIFKETGMNTFDLITHSIYDVNAESK
jgi:16S rRNA U516 pseudouridylate synthase RsuA-like enzyme